MANVEEAEELKKQISLLKEESESLITPASIYPCRRFCARIIDDLLFVSFGAWLYTLFMQLLTNLGLSTFFVSTARFFSSYSLIPTPLTETYDLLDLVSILLGTIFLILVNSYLISKTGTTVGKSFSGIKVFSNNQKLNFLKSLKRELYVNSKGRGLRMPILALLFSSFYYLELKKSNSIYSSVDESLEIELAINNEGWFLFLFPLIGLILSFIIATFIFIPKALEQGAVNSLENILLTDQNPEKKSHAIYLLNKIEEAKNDKVDSKEYNKLFERMQKIKKNLKRLEKLKGKNSRVYDKVTSLARKIFELMLVYKQDSRKVEGIEARIKKIEKIVDKELKSRRLSTL